MGRFKNRSSQFLIDVGVLMTAFWLSMLVRFDWNVPQAMFRSLMIILPYVVLLQYAFLSGFGITRFSWRFISLRDAVRIFVAMACASAVLVAIHANASENIFRMVVTLSTCQSLILPLN